MIEYTFYYKGKFYTFNANCVEDALTLVRERKGMQFYKDCVLTNSKPTTAAAVAKAVGNL